MPSFGKSSQAHFESKYTPEPNSGCWLWDAGCFDSGYGAYWHNGGTRRAHRVSWEIHKGAIPTRQLVLHKCDTPACVNPDHLLLGTDADNMADRDRKGRAAKGERGGRAKLLEKQVVAIRSDTGTTLEIAAAYGVSHQLVSAIKLRQCWKHI